MSRDEPDAGAKIDQFLAERGTTLGQAFLDAMRAIDREAWLRDAGITADVLAALRAGLLTT